MPELNYIYFDENNNMVLDCREDPDEVMLSQTFTPLIDFLLVAGGGSGANTAGGGGGGGGGHIYKTNQAITPGVYTVIVGTGGTNNNGENTTFSGYTAIGGGKGGIYSANVVNDRYGYDGGCGGGGGGGWWYAPGSGGTASQGYNGGYGIQGVTGYPGGGGGGGGSQPGQQAFGINNQGIYSCGGSGGTGFQCSILSGTPIYYCGGGGGSRWQSAGGNSNGLGGLGGGGNGSESTGGNGTPNTGGGGGSKNGLGGSGIAIFRYRTADFGTCSGGTISVDGLFTVHTFTSSGTLTLVSL